MICFFRVDFGSNRPREISIRIRAVSLLRVEFVSGKEMKKCEQIGVSKSFCSTKAKFLNVEIAWLNFLEWRIKDDY